MKRKYKSLEKPGKQTVKSTGNKSLKKLVEAVKSSDKAPPYRDPYPSKLDEEIIGELKMRR